MFGHWAQILLLLVIGLLVFGPKRVIEMGSSFGKAFREFREATRGMSWSSLTQGDDEPRGNAALSARDTSVAKLSRFTAANASIEPSQMAAEDELPTEPQEAPQVVEGEVDYVDQVEDTANS